MQRQSFVSLLEINRTVSNCEYPVPDTGMFLFQLRSILIDRVIHWKQPKFEMIQDCLVRLASLTPSFSHGLLWNNWQGLGTSFSNHLWSAMSPKHGRRQGV